MLDAIKSAVGDVADAVSGAVGDAVLCAALKVAESEIKKNLKKHGIDQDIDVDVYDLPNDKEWTDWLARTGCNSLCVEDTWDFLEDSTYNKRKRDKWAARGIKKIWMTVEPNPDPDKIDWEVCEVDWKEGDTEMTITWLPRALRWGGSSNTWLEGGYHSWWTIRDEIVFGLQLYQLPGKCFYKSDWLGNFEDVDPDGFLPSSKKKYRRWFQFRHWVVYWYPEALSGWNYQWTEKPPKNSDGSDFSLDNILSLPSLPSFSMPSLSLPSLPGMPSLSMPSMPSLSMPSLSMPSMSMPSLSMPSLSMPSLPEKPKRPPGKWACHGIIEMAGMKVKAKGKTIVLSDINLIDLWQEKNGSIKDERKEHQRLELECTDEEQAQSWMESLIGGGAEEGEVGGGCCTVA